MGQERMCEGEVGQLHSGLARIQVSVCSDLILVKCDKGPQIIIHLEPQGKTEYKCLNKYIKFNNYFCLSQETSHSVLFFQLALLECFQFCIRGGKTHESEWKTISFFKVTKHKRAWDVILQCYLEFGHTLDSSLRWFGVKADFLQEQISLHR